MARRDARGPGTIRHGDADAAMNGDIGGDSQMHCDTLGRACAAAGQGISHSSTWLTQTAVPASGARRRTPSFGALAPASSLAISVATDRCGAASDPDRETNTRRICRLSGGEQSGH
jgi:hypothetical protein